MRIAYVIPKFPGQTHIFFWREMQALRRLGVDVDPVSTQPAQHTEAVHEWAAEARRRTLYLYPMSTGDFARAAATLLAAGPRAWVRCFAAVAKADGESTKGRLRMFGAMLLGAKLLRAARARGWSHLHAHSAANAALICTFVRILGDIPYSLTLHGPLEMYGRGENIKWNHAAFGIAVTERLKLEILAGVRGIDGGKLEVAAMGVDLERFIRTRPYEPWVPGSALRLVSCGRLHPGKGHQDVIDAVSRLIAEGFDARLDILGEGPARSMLESRVRELGLADRVTLHGAVSEFRVREVLEQSHIFVLGSHDEAIGVATMEAMAMSLPVVVTHVGGVPELVREGIDGLLVPPKDPAMLAHAVRAIATDPVLAASAGRNGCERVHARFGSDVSAGVIARRLGIPAKEPGATT